MEAVDSNQQNELLVNDDKIQLIEGLREHLETHVPDTAQPTSEEVLEYETMLSK